MSAITTVTIDCDLCLEMFDAQDSTTSAVREWARNQGWQRRYVDFEPGRALCDLCPDCAEKLKAADRVEKDKAAQS